jgi:hypothetical protein
MINSIPFEVPLRFIGAATRHGALLKDPSTGRILGHLKEVGGLGNMMSSIPTGPLSGLSALGQHFQLAQIQKSIEAVKLISTIGAVASVANLGVSVAGFAIVIHKLNRIEKKLDRALEEIEQLRKIAERLDNHNKIGQLSSLQLAGELLATAEAASTEAERQRQLGEAQLRYAAMRTYYFQLLSQAPLWPDARMPLDAAYEAYSRYVACATGQLHAQFLIGDLGSFDLAHEVVAAEASKLCTFDRKVVFRAHTDGAAARGWVLDQSGLISLREQVVNADLVMTESVARIDTMKDESNYLKKRGISVAEYRRQLLQIGADGPQLIMLPHDFAI